MMATKNDDLKVERAFLDVHRQILRARGIDFDKALAEWATAQAKKLASPGARTDFAELCEHGRIPQALATAAVILRLAPQFRNLLVDDYGRC